MRYPEFLQDGQTIGFVAPSFGCTEEPHASAFLLAIDRWKKMGYEIHLGPNCYEEKGLGISNEPLLCAMELNEWYCSESNQALIACGGGELMCEIVPHLDFERMKAAKPKWYMGFSDNTNFTFLSATLMDTASIYGPCAPDFGVGEWHPSLQDAFDLLCGKKDSISGYDRWAKVPDIPFYVSEPTVIRRFPDEDAAFSGRLLGGCIDILQLYPGTRFDKVKEFNQRYKEDGVIWFLEACELSPGAIRRSLWQFKEAGWFEHVKGFLIGRPLTIGSVSCGVDHYHAVVDVLSEYQVPIIMDLDIGHLPPMMPIICGSTANVAVSGNHICIEYTYR